MKQAEDRVMRINRAVLSFLGIALTTLVSAQPIKFTVRALEPESVSELAGSNLSPSVSSDGRYLAFASTARYLPNTTVQHVFRIDTQTGQITPISLTTSGVPASGDSDTPSISSNGRYIAFKSASSNLNSAQSSYQNIYLRDTSLNTTVLASRSVINPSEGSYMPDVSDDGSLVVFKSSSSLTTGLGAGKSSIFSRNFGTNQTVLESRSLDGTSYPNGHCDYPGVTPDGRYVTYSSSASNLVATDTNGRGDIFVRDRTLATTSRVSLTQLGGQLDGNSAAPTISANGRWVAYLTEATNVIPQPLGLYAVVVVTDRETGQTFLASKSIDGSASNGRSYQPKIDSSGRYIIFESEATNLITGDVNDMPDVFRYDRFSDTVELVSRTQNGTPSDSYCGQPAITSDGDQVFFTTDSGIFDDNDNDFTSDVYRKFLSSGLVTSESRFLIYDPVTSYLYDISEDGNEVLYIKGGTSSGAFVQNLSTGSVVSHPNVYPTSPGFAGPDSRYIFSKGGTETPINRFDRLSSIMVPVSVQENGYVSPYCRLLSVSKNGRYALLWSQYSMTSDGVNSGLYRRDILYGTTQLVSRGYDGMGHVAGLGDMSSDGRYVIFATVDPNVVPGYTSLFQELYHYDCITGAVKRVTDTPLGDPASGATLDAKLSPDGRYVLFDSRATNLVPGIATRGLYLRDCLNNITTAGPRKSDGTSHQNSFEIIEFSTDGRYVSLGYSSDDLVANDSNQFSDGFLYEPLTGKIRIVTVGPGGQPGNGPSYSTRLSGNGRVIAFSSAATTFDPRDQTSDTDVYVRREFVAKGIP